MATHKITVAQDKIKEMLATYEGDHKKVEYACKSKQNGVGFIVNGEKGDKIELDLTRCPVDFMEHLMANSPDLTVVQRTALINWLKPTGDFDWNTEVDSPMKLHSFINGMVKMTPYNIEARINGRWYPVRLTSEYQVDQQHGAMCNLGFAATISGSQYNRSFRVLKYHFLDRNDEPTTYRMEELFKDWFNMRPLQQDINEFDAHVQESEALAGKTGTVMAVHGDVLVKSHGYGADWVIMTIGEQDAPTKVVVDKDLESNERNERKDKDITKLPFVRLFSLETKRWVFADIRDIVPHQWDTGALDRLILPEDMGRVLKGLFQTQVKSLFGDVLKGKHGGMIILANGPTGVGKTLTAEVFAEYTKRPLYVMEMFELGVDVKQVEENLDRIFKRVTRWNAVLLMDECDIFLQERDRDLTHNVMVGIFLRLMDYYKGLLFLTSNRGNAIDDAFKSRITLRLDYPKLDRSAREKIWATMFGMAEMTVLDGLDGIPDTELNGRQIRNMVRLIRAIHGKSITSEQVKETVKFACR
jgi:hypothetical protein